MRIWGTDVRCMCKKHLMGEHVEMHMFKSVIESGKSVDGYIAEKLLDTDRIQRRHDELVLELVGRGFSHNSPLAPVLYPANFVHRLSVSEEYSEFELVRRCPLCREGFELKNGKAKYQNIPVGGDSVRKDAAGWTVIYSGKPIYDSIAKRDKAVLNLERYRRKMRLEALARG